jgi:hypothetical protein
MSGLNVSRELGKLVSGADKCLPTTFCAFLSEWRLVFYNNAGWFQGAWQTAGLGWTNKGGSLKRSIHQEVTTVWCLGTLAAEE